MSDPLEPQHRSPDIQRAEPEARAAISRQPQSDGVSPRPSAELVTAPEEEAQFENMRTSKIPLRTLAPEYDESQHKTYVSHLNAAVANPQNRNIALTGRYGAGKSSILEQFIREQEDAPAPRRTLRISISTLGPDQDEDLTNRIQKELVKQLVYRPKPGELRASRFARLPELSWWRTGLEAAGGAVTLVGLLWLFGLRPEEDAFGTGSYLLPVIVLLLFIFAILWALRWHIGRRRVSQFSTGGTSISFEKDPESYFDAYLDELVAFFDATEPDIVIFEDLDRFNDPHIFDSLRELNTLVNASARWQARTERPLRFVYAIKDSLFERLGNDTVTTGERMDRQEDGLATADTAAQADRRANRTKFFEIVIPVVPFLSHSNARDLFLEEIRKLNLPASTRISRGLIDIVARHTTDMRLLINILNEFVVYAERLLWINQRAPGITADRLFALVVYKNFHLADFEALPQRESVLDSLESSRRRLVNESISQLRAERSSLASGATNRERQDELGHHLGARLKALLEGTQTTLTSIAADNVQLVKEPIHAASFWQPIAQASSVAITLKAESRYHRVLNLDRNWLLTLFPEVGDASRWLTSSTPSDLSRIAEIDEETGALRGASFQYLFDQTKYTLQGQTFASITENTLLSELARDLIERGYLDRFYAEYSSVFYGAFLGVDVANFFRTSVGPNEMHPQFTFTTPGAVDNVLAQAPEGYLHSRSALNIQIVDHLMANRSDDSSELVDFLTKARMETAEFLTVYLNTAGTGREALVAMLAARPWPELFNFMVCKLETDEIRVHLLSAALMAASDASAYQLKDDARALISRLHADIPAFTRSQPEASAETLFSFLATALPSIPSLRPISPELRSLAVTAQHYQLSADNIRTAAELKDEDSISADLLTEHEAVWSYCSDRIDDYLALVRKDEHTQSACGSPALLRQIINAHHEAWTDEQLADFLGASSATAAIPDINSLAREAWQVAVANARVLLSVANIDSYLSIFGVDAALAALLVGPNDKAATIAGALDADSDQVDRLVPQLLNAQKVLSPFQRVSLASQLLAARADMTIDLAEVTPTSDDLLTELLRAGLVEDRAATFAHFLPAGWAAIEPALRVSVEAHTFITPDLTFGHAASLLQDSNIPTATRRAILERFSQFVPAGGREFLATAPASARALGIELTPEALAQAAPVAPDAEDVLWNLMKLGGSVSPTETMTILASMPGDFVGFGGVSGHEFMLPDSPSLRGVLQVLKGSGVVETPRGGPRGRRKVRIV